MKKINGYILSFFFIALFSTSCKKADKAVAELPTPSTINQPVSTPEPKLLSVSYQSHSTKEMLISLAQLSGYGAFSTNIKYGINTYIVKYYTSLKGKKIIASGLVHIPDTSSAQTCLISLQHGTTFKKTEAPTANPSTSPSALLASTGYIALEPDFIGYGSSSDIFHPYYDKQSSADAVIDFISAIKELLAQDSIPYKKSLFMAGYSEGGYVTLAAFEEIEKHPIDSLTLKGVAAGAGGYDLKGMLGEIADTSYYPYPAYLAFILEAFNKTYQWNKPFSYFYAPSYASKLPNLLDGTHSGSEINANLSTNLDTLFNPVFYAKLKSGQATNLNNALAKNTITGWNTKAPLRLYHGTNDEIVPYSNTVTTYNTFLSAGADNVSFHEIPSGTHGSSFVPMLANFFLWFNTLKEQ